MGNIPARACDPYLQRKVYTLTGGTTAASLVKALAGKTYPSKTTLEQMYYDRRLFQEQKVRVLSEILFAELNVKLDGGGDNYVLSKEICIFDRYIYGFDDTLKRIAKQTGLSRDGVSEQIASKLRCRREFIEFVRVRTLLPKRFCELVVNATEEALHPGISERDIVRAGIADAVAPPSDHTLRRMLLNFLYPNGDVEFVQAYSNAV